MHSPNVPQGYDDASHDNEPSEVRGESKVNTVIVLDKLQPGLISEVDRLYNVPAIAFPDKGIPIGYSVPVAAPPEPEETYVELEDTEDIRRNMRLPLDQDDVDEVTFENVIQVDPEVLEQATAYKDATSKSMLDVTLKAGAMNLLACSEAFGLTESVLNQHFNVQSSFEDSVSPLLNGLLQLSVVSKVADSYELPSDIKNRYLQTLSHLIARNSHESSVKKTAGNLKSAVLRNLTATLDEQEEQQRTIGVRNKR